MRIVAVLLVLVSLVAYAEVRSGSGMGHNPSASTDGTITFVNMYPVAVSSAYGMKIQTSETDRLWISSWGDLKNYQFDMTTGSQTGTEFDITNGIDADGQGYCDYAAGGQFFFGDWTFSNIGVFDEAGTYLKSIAGPGGAWTVVTGVDAGNGMLYAADFRTAANEIGWADYDGSQSSVTWTTATFNSVSGMTAYGDYLIVCCQITSADNIFVLPINPDGSVNTTPVWSGEFVLEDMDGAGDIDFDGTYLWLYPQNTNLYQLTIDFTFAALEASTWSQIKTSF